MNGEDPLTSEERKYFETMSDHDRLMKLSQHVWGPDTGLTVHVTQNTLTLYGDGTKEHPGIVNILRELVDNQQISDKQRYRNLQLAIAALGVVVLLSDLLLAVFHIR
jgi:hypothetical protein